MSQRKVVQIAVSRPSDDGVDAIVALCDDGTMWEMVAYATGTGTHGWQLLPAIPSSDQVSA